MSTLTAQPSLLDSFIESFTTGAAETTRRAALECPRERALGEAHRVAPELAPALLRAWHDRHDAEHEGPMDQCADDVCSVEDPLAAAVRGSESAADQARTLHVQHCAGGPVELCSSGTCAGARESDNPFVAAHQLAGHGMPFWCCTNELCRAADDFAAQFEAAWPDYIQDQDEWAALDGGRSQR
ncbi:hypothetical protein [Branchiibius sp. NY16-3462-2]|uniref:hypothetical protein n=1 Tax=Branchiibius sp. NY16-3462-2 TaxID=1807500 RepID=UPI0007971633|nr:hypothetical protein [Branchiibius sp. NY16-3462-2]KYH43874.1 hypothetical protein AZH51_15690 [Branchiibius sp. NY16-3462-2]